MNVLQPISTAQNLIFIPRFDAPTVSIEIRDEETDTSETLTISAIYDNGYMTVEIEYPFKEAGNYTYEVSDLSERLMYRGKIFSTAQTDLQNYRTNPDFLYV